MICQHSSFTLIQGRIFICHVDRRMDEAVYAHNTAKEKPNAICNQITSDMIFNDCIGACAHMLSSPIFLVAYIFQFSFVMPILRLRHTESFVASEI